MKQLEKVCSKQKGIVSQTVKEIAVGLVSDDLIQSDKIGIGVFYWSFPSQSLIVRENKMNALDAEIEKLQKKIAKTRTKISEAIVGKEDTVCLFYFICKVLIIPISLKDKKHCKNRKNFKNKTES